MQLLFILSVIILSSSLTQGLALDTFSIEKLFASSDRIFNELETTDDERQCIAEFKHFVNESKLGAAWTVKVMDTWAKEPKGLHSEVSVEFGHYDQCIGTFDPFRCQHCHLNVEHENFNYTLGVCVPNSCSNKTVHKLLKPFFMNVGLSAVSATYCHNGDNPPFGVLHYFVMCLSGILILAAIVGTVQGLVGKKTLLTSFSLHHNTNRLFDQKSNFGAMDCLNGIRVISMLWVVLLHSYQAYFYNSALLNPNDLKQFRFTFAHAFIKHGELAVDTFFVVGGLLLAYNFLKAQETRGSFNIFKYYLHRYLRLIPVFAIVMVVTMAFLEHLGNGPIEYKTPDKLIGDSCKQYWWSALLLIQNYVNPSNMCITPAWYISADMQLYILSPLILFPLTKYGKKFYIVLVAICFASIGFTFFYSYFNEFHFNLRPPKYRANISYATHSRIGQWLIGVLLGFYLYQTREKKFQINKIVNGYMWILSLLTLIMIIYIPYTQYRDETKVVLEFAFYTAFHRIIWALAVSWIILACIKGHGGPVTWFLSFSFYQPLAKLSYAVYLIHFPLLLQIGTFQRSLLYFNLYTVFHFFLGILLLSLLLAIPVVLLVEMPIPGIESYIFKMLKNKL